jgi:hypothetical protein
MVWGHGDFADIVAFDKKVSAIVVRYPSVYYHSLRGSEQTNYLFIKEVCYLP